METYTDLSIDEIIDRIQMDNPNVIVWVDPFVGRNKSVIWTPNWMDLETGEGKLLNSCDSIEEGFVILFKYFDDLSNQIEDKDNWDVEDWETE